MRKEIKKITNYGFFGVVSAGVEFMTFLALSSFLHLYVASFLSFLFGLTFSFYFNKFIVFKNSKKATGHEAVRFVVLGLVNSQLSSVITYGLSIFIPKVIAKIVTMAMIAGWNYIIMNVIIFKKKEVDS